MSLRNYYIKNGKMFGDDQNGKFIYFVPKYISKTHVQNVSTGNTYKLQNMERYKTLQQNTINWFKEQQN